MIVDLHCDTISEIYKKKGLTLRENNLMIDIKKLKKSDVILQCFAMFTHLKDVSEPYKYVNALIDLYEEEINKLLNKESFESAKIDLKLSINAFLNSEFIGEDRLRLELYRRLSKCKEVAEVYEIEGEIEDRFGKPDIYTKQFLSLIIIKILAIKAGFKAISNAEQNIVLTAQNGEQTRLKSKSKDDDDVIEEILIYLRKLNKGRAEK